MVQQRKVPPAGRMKNERILLLWWHSVLAREHTPSSLQDNLLPTCQLCKLTPSSNRSVGRRNIYYFKTLQETFSYRENLNKLFAGPFTDEIADLRMSVAKRHRTALHGEMKTRQELHSWQGFKIRPRDTETWREIYWGLGDNRSQTTMHSHPRPEEICTLVHIHIHSHMWKYIYMLNMNIHNGQFIWLCCFLI